LATAGSAEQFRYFLVKEQCDKLRRDADQLAERLERSPRPGWLPPSVGSPRRRGLAKWGLGGRRLLRELAIVDDIHSYLKDLAGGSSRFGQQLDHQVQQLSHEAALVEAMAQFGESTCDEAVVIVSPRGAGADQATALASWYAHMFISELSLDCQPLSAQGTLRALTVGGPHALAVARAEEGTHLFCPKAQNLVPLQVSVVPVIDNDAEAARASFVERRRRWLAALAEGSATVDDDPQPLLPVVRVYSEGGATFDLRSGLSVAGSPTPHDLRSFVLAALEPPPEFVSHLPI